jgi:hypothetical protein
MNDTAHIGLDPGKLGFITLHVDGKYSFYPMPEHQVETGKLLKNGSPQLKWEFHEDGFRELTFEIKKAIGTKKLKVAIEEVGGRGGWSATNNFNFGYTAGMQKMIFIMLGAEITMVRPQKWQSFMRQGYDNIKKASSTGKTMINDPKAVAKMIVDAEYPGIDFRKTKRAKTDDDNKIDSFLLCLYLIRNG